MQYADIHSYLRGREAGAKRYQEQVLMSTRLVQTNGGESMTACLLLGGERQTHSHAGYACMRRAKSVSRLISHMRVRREKKKTSHVEARHAGSYAYHPTRVLCDARYCSSIPYYSLCEGRCSSVWCSSAYIPIPALQPILS
eukprot:1827170-Rhodomonas_salina.2